MADTRHIEIQFPSDGIDRSGAFDKQPPTTTVDSLNVVPASGITQRQRGGPRPGVYPAYPNDDLAETTNKPVRMLATVRTVDSDGAAFFQDDFIAPFDTSVYSPVLNGFPVVSPNGYVYAFGTTTSNAQRGAARTVLEFFDPGQSYTVGTYIKTYLNRHWGKYELYARLNNTTPDVLGDCIRAQLDLTSPSFSGGYSGKLWSYSGGVQTTETLFVTASEGMAVDGLFTMAVNGLTVICKWHGITLTTKTFDASNFGVGAGNRVGFGMLKDITETSGFTVVDFFRVDYARTDLVETGVNLLVGSANGTLWVEDQPGISMRKVTIAPKSLASDRIVLAQEQGGELFIADRGDVKFDGNAVLTSPTSMTGMSGLTGISAADDVFLVMASSDAANEGSYRILSNTATTVTLVDPGLKGTTGGATATFQIRRGPKVYVPNTDTLSIWETQVYTARDLDINPNAGTLGVRKGAVPGGCPLVALFLNRIVLAGNPGNVWYMSRRNNPYDWDYFTDDTDRNRAVAGPLSRAGTIGQPITAIAPWGDDYLIFFTANETYSLHGDPIFSSAMNNLSRTIGCTGATAWCYGPSGELWFLSRQGLYVLAPGGSSVPQAASVDRMPIDLIDIADGHDKAYTVSMVYDVSLRGVWLFCTHNTSNGLSVNFWFDYASKSFWPTAFTAADRPFTLLRFEPDKQSSRILLGTRSGYIDTFILGNAQDELTAIENKLVFGPIVLGQDRHQEALLMDMMISMSDQTPGTLSWSLWVGKTAEGVHDLYRAGATPVKTGTVTGGLNRRLLSRIRGYAVMLRISTTGMFPWSLEKIRVTARDAGLMRV